MQELHFASVDLRLVLPLFPTVKYEFHLEYVGKDQLNKSALSLRKEKFSAPTPVLGEERPQAITFKDNLIMFSFSDQLAQPVSLLLKCPYSPRQCLHTGDILWKKECFAGAKIMSQILLQVWTME